jgi:hypothetical protein
MAGFDGIVGIDLDFVVLLRASGGNKGNSTEGTKELESTQISRIENRMKCRGE